MKFETLNCPECGEPAAGSVERISGRANFTEPDVDGDIAHAGDTEVWWDEQKTVINKKGEWNLICYQGHEWFSKMIPFYVCACGVEFSDKETLMHQPEGSTAYVQRTTCPHCNAPVTKNAPAEVPA